MKIRYIVAPACFESEFIFVKATSLMKMALRIKPVRTTKKAVELAMKAPKPVDPVS